jgi:hypothetical protein
MEHVDLQLLSYREVKKAKLLYKEVVPSTTSAVNTKIATTYKDLKNNRLCKLLIQDLRQQEVEELLKKQRIQQ